MWTLGADFCMFDGELLSLLDPDITPNTLEKISLEGIAGSAIGYIVHIETGVNDGFFPVSAIFSSEVSPNEFGGLAGRLGFLTVLLLSLTEKLIVFLFKLPYS